MNQARRSGRGRPPGPAVTIIVEVPFWRADSTVIPLIRRAARTVLQSAPDVLGSRPAVSILLAGDQRLCDMNSQFRNRNKPTNVLSFPAAPELEPYLGDIALAYGVIRKQAEAQRKSLAEHAAHLAVHGVLHLLGYDHRRREEAAIMEKLEISHLSRLGIENPYRAVPVRQPAKRPKFQSCRKSIVR